MSGEKPQRKDNNFGSLRLLFASLVIVAHSPELLDGNRSRELLTMIFGTLSFGILGVAGFFIISGFLITKSFLSSANLIAYFKRRILRIYPAFALNFWLCLLILAPIVGAGLSVFEPSLVVRNLANMVFLRPPVANDVFVGMPYPGLNGAMWTIAYEFRCYILVALLGVSGMLRGKWRYALLATAVVSLAVAGQVEDRSSHGVAFAFLGTFAQNVHLVGLFGLGAMFALFQDHVVYNHKIAAAAAVLLVVALFFAPLVSLALGVLGGYLVFWFAFSCPVLPVSRFSNRTDLSYGIYLYGWPIQSAIAYFTHRMIDPWALSAATLVLAASAAWVSWTFLERPALALAHRSIPVGRRRFEFQ